MADITQVVIIGEPFSVLDDLLAYALRGIHYINVKDVLSIKPGKVLFACSISETGFSMPVYQAIEHLRSSNGLLKGCVGAIILAGKGELFTRSMGRSLLQSANMAGCAFIGKPLVEVTALYNNFDVLSRVTGKSKKDACQSAARDLINRLITHQKQKIEKPRVLALHAANKTTSNTLALWGLVRKNLESVMDIKEICLRNGTVADCEGCSYTACLHMGEKGSCFYGGVMVDEVCPALNDSDVLVLLCPNYNDALDANMTAFINRLTAMFRSNPFYKKALYALIVSGYSGGDIISAQLISALNINKAFILPPVFSMMETANDPGSILKKENIQERAQGFANAMVDFLT